MIDGAGTRAGISGQSAFLTFPDVEPSDYCRWNTKPYGDQDHGPIPRGVTLRDQQVRDSSRREEADCPGGELGSGPIWPFVNLHAFTARWTIGA